MVIEKTHSFELHYNSFFYIQHTKTYNSFAIRMSSHQLYIPLLNLAFEALELKKASKDKQYPRKIRRKARQGYPFKISALNVQVRRMVASAIGNGVPYATLQVQYEADMRSFRSASAPELQAAVSLLEETLFKCLSKEKNKGPIRRKIDQHSNLISIIVMVVIVVYVVFASQVDVTLPLNDPQGVIQRADAYHKEYRHTRAVYRHYSPEVSVRVLSIPRWVVSLPIRPSARESAFAAEFLNATHTIYQFLIQNGYTCSLATRENTHDEEIANDVWAYFHEDSHAQKIANVKRSEDLIALAIIDNLQCKYMAKPKN